MAHFEATVNIKRPTEEVFAWLTSAENHPRWDSISLEMHPAEPGPWHAGLEFRELRHLGGRKTPARSRVKRLEPGSRFQIESLSGAGWQGDWRFEPTPQGTRLHFQADLTLGFPARLFEPLIARSIRQDIAANFARLVRILEGDGSAALR